MRRRARIALLALWALVPALAAGAEGEPQLVALAHWEMHGGQLSVVAPLSAALTAKQRSMIEGGFTTVSQLTMRLAPDDSSQEPEERPAVYSVRCTVKFDAWEETYDVARLDEEPRTAMVKSLGEYGDLCLKADIGETEVLGRLMEKGGTVLAFLVVKQTSAEEAARIKDWLIQQQSGVMQSLFSHMLGELTLNQTLVVRVNVPPKPATVQERVKQEDVKKVKAEKKG